MWIETDEGIVLRKASSTTGRGMFVTDDLDLETREEVAEAFRADLRESRETAWAIE